MHPQVYRRIRGEGEAYKAKGIQDGVSPAMMLVNNINKRVTRNVIVPSKAIKKKALAIPEEFCSWL